MASCERTGSSGHSFHLCIGSRQQGREDHRLSLGQPMGTFAIESGGRGSQALDFATKAHKIQVGFENLFFGPCPLQIPRRLDLSKLLPDRLSIRRGSKVLIQQGHHLHRDRTGPPDTACAIDHRRSHRQPIHPMMVVKAMVFGLQHHSFQRR